MQRFSLFFFLTFFSVSSAQKKIIFKYDQAGNQVYRGVDSYAKTLSTIGKKGLTPQQYIGADEDELFWAHIKLYPVPVSSILTITWDTDVDYLIKSVSLYEHNSLVNLFTKTNIPNLYQKVQIQMQSYRLGVYIVSFQLKDGRILTKNIIKE